MPRYVVYSRKTQPAEQNIDRLLEKHGVIVIDSSVGRVMLVEASEATARNLREHLRDWVISEEVTHPRPAPPKHRIQKEDV